MSKTYEHKVSYYETDAMQVVHHSNYIRWFEDARIDWLDQIGFGYKQMEEEGIQIPVISTSAKYHKPLRFSDTALVEMHISQFTPVRMTVEYRIYNKETGEHTTSGETEHCFINQNTGRPVSLKRKHPHILEIFQQAYNETNP